MHWTSRLRPPCDVEWAGYSFCEASLTQSHICCMLDSQPTAPHKGWQSKTLPSANQHIQALPSSHVMLRHTPNTPITDQGSIFVQSFKRQQQQRTAERVCALTLMTSAQRATQQLCLMQEWAGGGSRHGSALPLAVENHSGERGSAKT